MKPFLRAARKLALWCGMALVAAAAGLWFGRDALLRRVADELLPQDGSVALGQIRWTGWLQVGAEDVRLAGPGWTAAVRSAAVRAEYDLDRGWRLSELAFRDVQVAGGPAPDETAASEASWKEHSLPADLPRASIEGLRLDWTLDDGRTVALRDAHATLDGLALDVEAGSAAFRGADFSLEAPLEASLRGAGPGLKRVDLVEWNWDPRVELRRGHFDWSGATLQAELDAHLCSGDVDIRAAGGPERLEVAVVARGIDAREAAAWAGGPECAGRLDLQASLLLVPDDPGATRVEAQVSLARGSVAGRELDARATIAYAHGRLEVRDALVQSGANIAWIHVAQLPLSGAAPCEWPATAALAAHASLHDLSLALADARAATTARVEVRAVLQDGMALLDGSAIESDDGAASAEVLRLHVPPLLEGAGARETLLAAGRDPRTRLAARWSFHDLGDTLRFFGLAPPESEEEFLGRAEGLCRWEGGAQGGRLELDAQVHGARVLDARVDALRLHGVLEDGTTRMARLEVAARTSLGDVDGSGSWDIDARRIDVQGRLALLDLSRLPFPLRIAGDARADLRLQGPLDDLDGHVDLRADRLAVEGVELSALELQASREGEQWSVQRAAASWQGAAFELAGDARRTADGGVSARLESARIVRGAQDWSLARPTQAALGADGLLACTADWRGSEGELQAQADLELDTLRGRLSFEAALHDLQRVPELGLPQGSTSADWIGKVQLEFEGRPRSLIAEGVARLALPGQSGPLAARGSVRWTPERVAADLEALELLAGAPSAGPLLSGELHVVLPLEDGALARTGDTRFDLDLHAGELAALLPDRLRGRLSGSLDIRARIGGTPTALSGEAQMGLGSWRYRHAAGDEGIGPFHAQLEARLGPGGVELQASQASLQGVTRTTLAARLDLAPDLHTLLAAPGILLDAPLHLEAGGELGDLSPLAGQLEAVRRLQGRITGRVVVAGSLREPRAGGEVRLEDGELRLAADVPAMSALQATVRFDDRRADLFDARGELGGAPFVLRGGARWDEAEPVLDLALDGEELLLLRSRHLTVRADAQLKLAGPASSPLLSGRLVLADGRWTKPLDPLTFALRPRTYRGDGKDGLFRLDDPLGSRLRFDVQIEARTAFRVENELLRLRLVPMLKLGGTGSLPTLAGEIRLEPSRAYLPASIVELEGGALRFRPSLPDTIELEVAGRATAMGYDVSLQIGGTVDEPLVQLSSSPPASREDLALLVLTGRPPGGSVFGSGERAARGVALYVARDLLSSGPSEPGSMMERIEIVSGAHTSRRGLDTIELRLRVGGEGRYEALYLAAERDVHEDWNYGLRFVWRPR